MDERAILLVEDDVSDVELTRWAFENSNIDNQVVVAGDGAEALHLLLPTNGRTPLRPAFVLMDIYMPRMGGVEALRRLRADPCTSYLPVIMLTSSIHDKDILDSCGVGANSYVQKPLGTDDFLHLTSTLGVFWLGLHRQAGYPLTIPERP